MISLIASIEFASSIKCGQECLDEWSASRGNWLDRDTELIIVAAHASRQLLLI